MQLQPVIQVDFQRPVTKRFVYTVNLSNRKTSTYNNLMVLVTRDLKTELNHLL
jgi:hypothetical protein